MTQAQSVVKSARHAKLHQVRVASKIKLHKTTKELVASKCKKASMQKCKRMSYAKVWDCESASSAEF